MQRFARSFVCVGRMLSSKPAPKAPSGPNWNRMLASACSEEEKAAISAVRASLQNLQSLVVEAEKPASPIDWKHFDEAITDKTIVKEFKSAYDKLSFKDVEDIKKIPEAMNADRKAATEEVKKITEQVSKFVASLEQQLSDLESSKNDLQSTTVDAFLKKNPELDKKYTEEIKNDKWF